MQNTQQHTPNEIHTDYDLDICDFASPHLSFDSNIKVELTTLRDDRYGWLIDDFILTQDLLRHIVKLPTYLEGKYSYRVLDIMEHYNLPFKGLNHGEEFITIEGEDGYSTILWTPKGLKKIALMLPRMGCSSENSLTFYDWIHTYSFFGEFAKEDIIRKRAELINSNGNGWMFNSLQLSRILGVRADSIRTIKWRHPDKLTKDVHWKYPTSGNRTLLFTKLGCLVISSLVGTKEAQRTREFLELAFDVTNEELILATGTR